MGDKSGFNAPTPSISAAYEKGDPRKAISMADGYVSDPGGQQINEKYVKSITTYHSLYRPTTTTTGLNYAWPTFTCSMPKHSCARANSKPRPFSI